MPGDILAIDHHTHHDGGAHAHHGDMMHILGDHGHGTLPWGELPHTTSSHAGHGTVDWTGAKIQAATAHPDHQGFFASSHHADCDKAYAHDPVQKWVCNTAEKHHFMDSTRHCLQHEQSRGVGAVQRHLDCWGQAVSNWWGK